MNKIKASCVAVVFDHNSYHKATLISYSGGYCDIHEYNIWEEEINNSPDIDDIFFDYPQPPKEPGFYVWEGELEGVPQDQPIFYGAWRPATKDDMSALIK